IGNEGVFMNYRGLNTVAEYAFAADQYAFLTFDHHFDGAILQLIPLFRKMRLRSVANFRALYGTMTAANRSANELNLFENTSDTDQVRIQVPDGTPFMEASVGVENIFRFFRVDAIWRLNRHDLPGKRFGVRASVSFNL
ncbi:MAG: hypothetical protein AAF840_15130, partial [Bacteroidota bacterium]